MTERTGRKPELKSRYTPPPNFRAMTSTGGFCSGRHPTPFSDEEREFLLFAAHLNKLAKWAKENNKGI